MGQATRIFLNNGRWMDTDEVSINDVARWMEGQDSGGMKTRDLTRTLKDVDGSVVVILASAIVCVEYAPE